MYIRCAQCQATTWIRDAPAGAAGVAAACEGCGQDYPLANAATLGATARDQYRAALAFAERERVDLPSAYSVLLGIMTLPQARAVRGRPATPRPDTPPAVAAAARTRPPATGAARHDDPARPRRPREGLFQVAGELSYDPGFREAVAAGTLTATQAMERGDREALAERLARLHAISLRRAYDVADNRRSIREARGDEQRARALAALSGTMPAETRRKFGVAGIVALMFLAATGLFGWNLWSRLSAAPVPPAPLSDEDGAPLGGPANRETVAGARPESSGPLDSPAFRGAAVLTDAEGRIVEVAGPNPMSVLVAYCATEGAGDLEPLELTSTVPPHSGSRLGVFRDFDRLGRLQAIRIRRDTETRRWVVGDGVRPVLPFEAPEIPAAASRIRVQ